MDSDKHCHLAYVSVTTKLLVAADRIRRESQLRSFIHWGSREAFHSEFKKRRKTATCFMILSHLVWGSKTKISGWPRDPLIQGVRSPWRLDFVPPNVCESSIWNILRGTLLAPTVLRWRIYILENLCISAHKQSAIHTKDLQYRIQEYQNYSRPVKSADHM